jgi:hypothetical protein
MARYAGGTLVPGGYYLDARHASIVAVTDEAGMLPGTSASRYVRISWVMVVLLAPVLGGLYVVALPFVGLATMLRWAWAKLTGAAREGAQDLAATVTPGWRPGEAHLTGRPLDAKSEQLPAGGAGESALRSVADEIARKRRENGND